MNVCDCSFPTIDGGALPLAALGDKPVLVVNAVPKCGFAPQNADFEALCRRRRRRVILGVPSNDIGGREPGTEAEIKSFCERSSGVDLLLYAKEKVIGTETRPFYRWGVGELGEVGTPRSNFRRYMIDLDGTIRLRMAVARQSERRHHSRRN